MTITVSDAAWLAGLWDGEGSVGVYSLKCKAGIQLVPQIQINMTHLATIEKAAALVRDIGCHTTTHAVVEGGKYRDSYRFSVRRTEWVKLVADTLIPYSVTKAELWLLTSDLCAERIARQGLNPDGTLRRGGPPGWAKPYTLRESDLARQMRALNMAANNRSAERLGEQ